MGLHADHFAEETSVCGVDAVRLWGGGKGIDLGLCRRTPMLSALGFQRNVQLLLLRLTYGPDPVQAHALIH